MQAASQTEAAAPSALPATPTEVASTEVASAPRSARAERGRVGDGGPCWRRPAPQRIGKRARAAGDLAGRAGAPAAAEAALVRQTWPQLPGPSVDARATRAAHCRRHMPGTYKRRSGAARSLHGRRPRIAARRVCRP
eukprot:5323246-Prymnesium_polylepis.1